MAASGSDAFDAVLGALDATWPDGRRVDLDAPGFFRDLPNEPDLAALDPRFAASVIETMAQGVLILTIDGTCAYANPAAASLLGYQRDALIGADVYRAIHPEPEPGCAIRETFLDALPRLDQPDRFTTSFGWLPVHVSVDPLVTDGEVNSVIVMFSDATQQVARMVAEHRARQAQASALEHMKQLNAQKTDFVYTVSHELRTPLTSVMGYLELAIEDPDVTGETREWLDIAYRNARRLLTQVEALLLVSRIEAKAAARTFTTFDLAVPLLAAVDTVHPVAADKQVTIVANGTDTPTPVHGDAGQVEQVAVNLLSNAVKFTPPGGTVWVTVTSDADHATVEVEDTGCGVPEQEQQHLFTKFFRSTTAQRSATPGTGLGLAIVKAIVEEHGGSVGVHSREGAGSVFAFTLPRGSHDGAGPT